MKVGKKVWVELKLKGKKEMHEVKLTEYGRGDTAKIQLSDGREIEVKKDRLLAKKPVMPDFNLAGTRTERFDCSKPYKSNIPYNEA